MSGEKKVNVRDSVIRKIMENKYLNYEENVLQLEIIDDFERFNDYKNINKSNEEPRRVIEIQL